jgi:hypothetical protein
MKVNLTRLLESPTRIHEIKQDDRDNRTSAVFVVTNNESTSSYKAYSFELEKEVFSLES